jgi:predicted nucleic acid-binding protein
MKKLVIYLDTSVINFLFADDAPEKRDITNEFFQEVAKGKFDVYISDAVIDEISRASEDKKEKLMKVIADYGIQFFEITDDALNLGKKLIERGIIPSYSRRRMQRRRCFVELEFQTSCKHK